MLDTTGEIYPRDWIGDSSKPFKMADVNLTEKQYVRFADGKGKNFGLLINTWPSVDNEYFKIEHTIKQTHTIVFISDKVKNQSRKSALSLLVRSANTIASCNRDGSIILIAWLKE